MTKDERKAYLIEEYGRVWTTDELTNDFEVIAFGGPGFVEVVSKETGNRGSLAFDHMPRLYYDYREYKK